jgi:hypothetical protein
MKTIVGILILASCINFQETAPDKSIVNYYRSKKYINVHNFLFTPNEIIELCKDSVGRRVFEKNIKQSALSSANTDEGKEQLVLLRLVADGITAVNAKAKDAQEARKYALDVLNSYKGNFTVDVKLIKNRITWSEARAETCDLPISSYIFYVYNPELFIQAARLDDDLKKSKDPFPYQCTLEDESTPLAIRRKIKEGLTRRLLPFKDRDPKIAATFKGVSEFKL